MPFSFALVLQFGALSARLRLCACVCISGEVKERLRFRRLFIMADAGVARLEPLEEKDRRLRGV